MRSGFLAGMELMFGKIWVLKLPKDRTRVLELAGEDLVIVGVYFDS